MTTMSSSDVTDSTTLWELSKGRYVSMHQLKSWLPDVEAALWFAKVFDLDYYKVSELLGLLFETDVMEALLSGDHSTELQDYLVEMVPDDLWPEDEPDFVDAPPPAEVLPQLWEAATIQVAQAIKDVAAKLGDVIQHMPSKEGRMVFGTMAKMNRLRPTIGDYVARIHHAPVPDVLVVLDVSGSMTESTVRSIIDEVVALSWKSNAHLAIVSNDAFHWEPGSYNVDDVLAKAQYGGTQYEMLKPLFDRDWGTVITIADYDSSASAKQALSHCTGRVGTVLDISLVNRPTYLAECVGQLASEIKPLLIARGIIRSYGW